MFFGGGGPGGGGGQPPFFFPGFGPRPNGPAPGGAGGFNPLEMLFGGGFGHGGPGNMQVDPTLIENFFGPGAAAGFHMGAQTAPAEEPRNSAPPTSKSILRSLPRIKVSKNDIEKNESNECSICLDELVLGQPALRIPCGHLYHEDCVYDWLKKSNECPVCRFELPTDDATYEQGRQERMADRKIRLRYEDLAGRSAAELKRLAQFLKIDTKGCLEKSEFVERIAASSQVQIVESHEATDAAAASSSIFDYAVSGTSMAEAAPASSSGIEPMSCDDPSESRDKRPHAASEDMNDAAMQQEVVPPPPPLASQSVGQLRQLAKQLNVSLNGCLEKDDIVQRIRAAPEYREP